MYKDDNLIVVDGDCILCSNSAKFIIKHDGGRFKFTYFNSEYLRNKNIKLNKESVVLIKNGVIFTKSDAFFEIVKELNSIIKYLQYLAFIPKGLRNFIYDLIVKYRYKIFGKKNQCLINEIDLSRLLK